MTEKTMKETNDAFVETLNSTLRKNDKKNHLYEVVRKKGTPPHDAKSLKSLTTFNSSRAGFTPSHEMTIRRPSPLVAPSPTI